MNEIKNFIDECPFKIVYKKRIPNPGYCKVISINWEEKKLSVTNGSVRLFPSFHEVIFIGK